MAMTPLPGFPWFYHCSEYGALPEPRQEQAPFLWLAVPFWHEGSPEPTGCGLQLGTVTQMECGWKEYRQWASWNDAFVSGVIDNTSSMRFSAEVKSKSVRKDLVLLLVLSRLFPALVCFFNTKNHVKEWTHYKLAWVVPVQRRQGLHTGAGRFTQ
ncbi:hypothetical protein [Zobellella endophytica]|uniref:hypothetical protein n=1 Tax=Zobellella endophytica TaxID=2116700 RepID=UPI0011B24644|nr:hypothetical protein [Zobellella endophytica]